MFPRAFDKFLWGGLVVPSARPVFFDLVFGELSHVVVYVPDSKGVGWTVAVRDMTAICIEMGGFDWRQVSNPSSLEDEPDCVQLVFILDNLVPFFVGHVWFPQSGVTEIQDDDTCRYWRRAH